MTTMTTMTFANNQKELDRKIEQITQDNERRNPSSNVEIQYINPTVENIHFTKHQATQFLIKILLSDKINFNN